MIVKRFVFNAFSENTYLLYDETKECIIIDAGCSDKFEQQELSNFIESQGLSLKALVNTHGHVDHVMGISYLSDKYQVSFGAHADDLPLIQHAEQMAAQFGFETKPVPAPTRYIVENDTIEFGNSSLKAIHIPGHSPGSLVFYSEKDGFVMVGDVLFGGSIGRTDLPGGNYQQLLDGIHNKLLSLPDKTLVYSGHGAPTTIGKERVSNPFLIG